MTQSLHAVATWKLFSSWAPFFQSAFPSFISSTLTTAFHPICQPHTRPTRTLNIAHGLCGCLGSITPTVSTKPVIFLLSSLSLLSSYFSSFSLHFPIKAAHREVGSVCFVFCLHSIQLSITGLPSGYWVRRGSHCWSLQIMWSMAI